MKKNPSTTRKRARDGKPSNRRERARERDESSAGERANQADASTDEERPDDAADALQFRLARDLRASAATLSVGQARFLVDTYYQVQQFRIEAAGQVRAATAAQEPSELTAWLATNMKALEASIKSALDEYSDAHRVGRWAKSQKGIGPVLAAGLLAHIDVGKAKTAGSLWRFAGLDPSRTWNKGEKRPWNARLKVLCVLPDQRVTTRRGFIPIAEIEVGDEVLTHQGRWRSVTEIHERQHDGETVGLRAYGGGNQVAWVTPEHPVYAAPRVTWRYYCTIRQHNRWRLRPDQPELVFGWHEAGAVEGGWLAQAPALPLGATIPEIDLTGPDVVATTPGAVAATGRWAGTPHQRAHSVPARRLVDGDLAELLGLYIAEGHVSGNHIGWSFHEREEGLVAFTQRGLHGAFGLPSSVSKNEPNHSVQVIATCKPLARWLATHLGKGAHAKRVPLAWLTAPPEILVRLVRGIFLGDGSFEPDVRLATVSETLAYQVREILRMLGVRASLHRQHDGRAWRVLVLDAEGCRAMLVRGQSPAPPVDPGVVLRDSLRRSYAGPVYNLEVEEDQSYVVEGLAVHNCWKLGESFVKVSGAQDAFYGRLWAEEKVRLVERNERGEFAPAAALALTARRFGAETQARGHYEAGHLPPAHVHARAKRWVVKLFLSHYHEVAWQSAYGTPAPRPYVIAIQGHQDYVAPPGWPCE